MPNRLRVLVVDDHPGIVKALSRLLSAAGHDVVGGITDFTTVPEAVQELEPHVVVLDVNLKSVDGIEVCRRIIHSSPGVKVIVFTAADDSDIRQRAREAGAVDFVDKRALDGDLLSAIKRLAAGPG